MAMQLQPWTGKASYADWRRRAGKASLTPDQVREIRASAETNAVLAAKLGVPRYVVEHCRAGKTYQWVDKEVANG